jgi:hypothetical protein
MAMINRHLQQGDLLRVEEAVPSISLPILNKDGKPQGEKKGKQKGAAPVQTTQLARCFAFRQGDRLAIGLLNLKAPGKRLGVDLGDGTTACRLKLPVATARKITLVSLRGDPLAGNTEAQPLEPEVREIPAAALANGVLTIDRAHGSPADGLPPCSFSIYVCEGAR